MNRSRIEHLQREFSDYRGRRVVFLSHCLLNENVRYLGGAGRSAGIEELVRHYMSSGIGVYQMPCPEQRVWGGVLKHRLLTVYGVKGSWVYRLRRPLMGVMLGYTRLAYARLARVVVQDIVDYQRCGFEVVGIVGVSASPSCGVLHTLDISRSVDVIAGCDTRHSDAFTLNSDLIGNALIQGSGHFIRSLRKQLAQRGLHIPFIEHDLIDELRHSGLLHPAHGPT